MDSNTCLVLVSLLLLYKFVLHPVLFSPLSSLPNAHFTCSFSNLWIAWQRYQGRGNRVIHVAHARFGPVVRLGRTEISVNSANAVKESYSNALEKDEWYARAFENYG